MAASSPRRKVWGIAITAGVIGVVTLALPYVASTRLVGDRIAEEMSAWSGLEVSIGSAPEIRVWPDLQADLTDVTLSLPGGAVIATAGRVEIELSALAALGGEIDFTAARFIDPAIRLDNDGSLPVLPQTGRIARAIETASAIVAENRGAPDAARLPAENFGTLEFVNGRIVRQFDSIDVAVATALTGRIGWETLNGRMDASAKGVLKGEAFTLDLSSASPLLLLGGATTPATLTLKSALVNLAFDGAAGLGDNPYAAGQARFSAPSVRTMLTWAGAHVPVGPAVEAMAVESRIMADSTRVRFEDATVTLDGKSARGVLDLLLNGTTPKVSGSLAFDTLDLGAFLSTFTPFDPLAAREPGYIDADFASQLNLDLRLSAARASLGTTTLTNLAATTRVDGRLAAFDISDASAFDGNIQAGLRFDHKAGSALVEMRLLASDVSGEAFGQATNLAALSPKGRGSVSLILKGTGESWGELMAHASGSFSANFGAGVLPGFDIQVLLDRLKGGARFPLGELTGGSSQIDGLDLKVLVADGVALIEKAEIGSPLQRIGFSGTVPLNGGSLGLSGRAEPSLQATAEGAEPAPPTTFLIEGPMNSATVIPTTGLSAQ